MQDQLTVSSSVLPSYAQHPSRHHRHLCPRPPHHPAAAAGPAGVQVGATSGSNTAGASISTAQTEIGVQSSNSG